MANFFHGTLKKPEQIEFFKSSDGYLDLNNDDLAEFLINLDLNGDAICKDSHKIVLFIPWAFTASFLQMINSWQWFFSGVLLGRQSYMPAQVNQALYYSIFFSSFSFLYSQLKGMATIAVDYTDGKDVEESKTRKSFWLNYGNKKDLFIELAAPSNRGGEHQTIAHWFYDSFNKWGAKNNYPDVVEFITKKKFHTNYRNLYTYSLGDISEELYHDENPLPMTNDEILMLWNRNYETVQEFPEVFWALEHLKVITEIHLHLIETVGANKALKFAQKRLLTGLFRHHEKTGLSEVLDKIFGSIKNEGVIRLKTPFIE